MFMRVTRGTFDTAKSKEITQGIAAIVTALKAMPGCQNVQVGMDTEVGRSIAVSTFDTREHASFGREKLGAAFSNLTALGYAAQPPEIYEQQ